MADVRLSDRENGGQIVLRMGDALVVQLQENAGGGYRWTLTSADPARLENTEHHYEPVRAGVGSAGASVWTFTPKQTGPTSLELKKVRPWEPDNPAAERFAVHLDIRA